MSPDGSDRVVAVVPVKPLEVAKSRLGLPADQRRALALAFAVDTVTALVESPSVVGVVVVTSDPAVARRTGRLGALVATDPGTGLSVAVRSGVRAARTWRPAAGVLVAPGDLPRLTSYDVEQVLALAGADPTTGAFVPDRSGAGTTLVVHGPGHPVVTGYGRASAARHLSLGLRRLAGAPAGARHDVDTVEDLRAACALGVGRASGAAARALVLALGVAGCSGHVPVA